MVQNASVIHASHRNINIKVSTCLLISVDKKHSVLMEFKTFHSTSQYLISPGPGFGIRIHSYGLSMDPSDRSSRYILLLRLIDGLLIKLLRLHRFHRFLRLHRCHLIHFIDYYDFIDATQFTSSTPSIPTTSSMQPNSLLRLHR